MKNMIYQVCLGAKSKLYEFCTASVKAYADRIGADYIIQTEPILKICPDEAVTNRSKESYGRLGYLPIYEKENAFAYLDRYENIAIIDADIYIKESAPNIFEKFSGTFGAVVEQSMPITIKYRDKILSYSRGQYGRLEGVDWQWNDQAGARFMNMGLIVINKSIEKYLKGQTPEEFIRRKEFKQFVDGMGNWKWSTDQTLLNYWIRKEKMNIQELDWRWNALYNAIEPNQLPKAWFIHFFLKDHLPEKGENIELLRKAIE